MGWGGVFFHANFIMGRQMSECGAYVHASGTDMMGICNFEKTVRSRKKARTIDKRWKKGSSTLD